MFIKKQRSLYNFNKKFVSKQKKYIYKNKIKGKIQTQKILMQITF